MAAQTGQTSRRFLLSGYQNVDTIPEDNIYNHSVSVPEVVEQSDINRSAVMQVGRQLAIIGDECNRTYSGKLEDSLFCIAKGIAATAFQTCIWRYFKSVVKSVGSFFNSGWRKQLIDHGCWVLWLPLSHVWHKWVPAILFAILMWWLIIYGLQN